MWGRRRGGCCAGEYGFLAMNGIDGYGYGVPLSYVYAGDRIYFHCAPQGYKLECLAADARVCFCVVGHTRVVPEDFTTAYESAMAIGRVVCGLYDSEKAEALDGLVRKYSPDHLVRRRPTSPAVRPDERVARHRACCGQVQTNERIRR
ncbi:MAG: pyridoxamine 5'-phosphate oxidase family protein [Alistipes onderdonkii]